MQIKGLDDEDFTNYKFPSMFIASTTCDWKCCKESGLPIEICQNCSLAQQPNIDIPADEILRRFINNPISKTVVCGGLEPMLQFDEICELIALFRQYKVDCDFVLYTGYYEDEIADKIEKLKQFGNIVLKIGRFIPNQKPHYDEVLGVELASDNQKGVRIC